MAELPSREELRQIARGIFASRGIDPNVSDRVLMQESGFNPAAKNINAKEESYGLGQLNVKGGLGVEARKRGIEPSDPTQYRKQLEFMADTVKRDGWRQWYGAHDIGVGRWEGVGGAPKTAESTPQPPRRPDGAPGPADTPTLPQNVDKGVLASLYSPFEKIAEQQKETQRTLDETQKAAMAQLNQPAPVMAAPPPQQPPPVQPSSPDANFAALMLPRIRRGLLADTSNYGLLS